MSYFTIVNNIGRDAIKYYEIENSIDERRCRVTGRYVSLEAAKADLANKCNWFASKGTGTIYEVTLIPCEDNTIVQERKEIYSR